MELGKGHSELSGPRNEKACVAGAALVCGPPVRRAALGTRHPAHIVTNMCDHHGGFLLRLG